MNFFTLLFIIFTIILYAYLLILRSELVFVAERKSKVTLVVPILVAIMMVYISFPANTLDEFLRGLFAILLVLSYLINARGIAEDRFILHSLDNRGIKFTEIDRVVLFQDTRDKKIKLNFFRKGLRGPLLKLDTSTEELVAFLADRLKQGTPIDVIVSPQNRKG